MDRGSAPDGGKVYYKRATWVTVQHRQGGRIKGVRFWLFDQHDIWHSQGESEARKMGDRAHAGPGQWYVLDSRESNKGDRRFGCR